MFSLTWIKAYRVNQFKTVLNHFYKEKLVLLIFIVKYSVHHALNARLPSLDGSGNVKLIGILDKIWSRIYIISVRGCFEPFLQRKPVSNEGLFWSCREHLSLLIILIPLPSLPFPSFSVIMSIWLQR